MLKIKLRPVGKKKQISFRLIVAEARSKLKGKFIDDLGWYNPHTDKFSLNEEKVRKWLSQGVQPTETVHNILVSAGIISGPKIPLHKKSKKEVQNQSSGEVNNLLDANSSNLSEKWEELSSLDNSQSNESQLLKPESDSESLENNDESK